MSLNVILGENWLSLVVFWVPDAGTQSAPKSTRIKKTNNYQTTRTKPGAVNRGQARTSRTHKDLTDPQDSPWLVSAPTSCLWEKLWNLQLASGEFGSLETRTWISFLQIKWVQVHSSEWFCQIWHVSLHCVLPVFSSCSVLTPCRCWQVKLHLLVSEEFWVMEFPSSIALSRLLGTVQV